MKKLLNYLNQNGLEGLIENFSVKVKEYDQSSYGHQPIYVLNYDQIETPKNEVTNLCRGTIVTFVNGSCRVVCSSIERFFNLGESNCSVDADSDISKIVFPKKVDGSLMKVWYNSAAEKWVVGSRGTAFAESEVNGHDVTFAELFAEAAGKDWHIRANTHLYKGITYHFELTSPLNRVVTRYDETSVWFLTAQETSTGEHIEKDLLVEGVNAVFKNIRHPEVFQFNSVHEMLLSVHELENLEEGYVGYIDNKPVVKVKSPAYVAAHRIKGEGLTPKRIIELIVINEHEEYLAVFPEDEKYFAPYVGAYANMLCDIADSMSKNSGEMTDKEFALRVKDLPYSHVLFTARKKNENVHHVFMSALSQGNRATTLTKYMDWKNETNC